MRTNHTAVEPLEIRTLFNGAIDVSLDLSKFDSSGKAGEKYKSSIGVTLTNTGDVAIVRTNPHIRLAFESMLNDAVVKHVGVGPVRPLDLGGLKPGKSKTFNLKVAIQPNALEGDYTFVARMTDENGSPIPYLVTGPTTDPVLSVEASNATQATLVPTALKLSSSARQGKLTLSYTGTESLHGKVPLAIYASAKNARDLTIIDDDFHEKAVAIFGSRSVTVNVGTVQPGGTFTVPLTLPKVVHPKISYEYFVAVNPETGFTPQTSDASALASVEVDSSRFATSTIEPNDVIRNAVFKSVPGPVHYLELDYVRPTSAVREFYGIFVDADGRQGMYDYDLGFISTDEIRNLGAVKLRYADGAHD